MLRVESRVCSKWGLDEFMAETTVEKVQSRMEASVFPVTSESEQPGAFCPRAKDWHEFSYAKSLTRIQAQMRRSS